MNVARTFFIVSAAAALVAGSAIAAPSLEERIQERTRGLAEQHQPRTAVAVDPAQLGKFTGIYQRAPNEFFIVTQKGEHLLLDVRVPGTFKPPTLELSAESPAKFFSVKPPIQISFPQDTGKAAVKLMQHSGGFTYDLPRVDETVVTRAMDAVALRIKTKTPQPDSAAKLRRFIEGFQRGAPAYGDIGSEIATLYATDLLKDYTAKLQSLGALTSLTFVEVGPDGADKYTAAGDKGRADITIDLSGDGKIDAVIIGKVEKP